MGFDRIIALDLGKFNSVACTTDVHTRRHGVVGAVATTPQAMHDFFLARIDASDEPARTLVVFESCDVAGWRRCRRLRLRGATRRPVGGRAMAFHAPHASDRM